VLRGPLSLEKKGTGIRKGKRDNGVLGSDPRDLATMNLHALRGGAGDPKNALAFYCLCLGQGIPTRRGKGNCRRSFSDEVEAAAGDGDKNLVSFINILEGEKHRDSTRLPLVSPAHLRRRACRRVNAPGSRTGEEPRRDLRGYLLEDRGGGGMYIADVLGTQTASRKNTGDRDGSIVLS